MMFDYIDRQIIASMFPFLKSDWLLTDAQLGALVSVVSVTVAVFGIPVALGRRPVQPRQKHRGDGNDMEHRDDRLHVRPGLRPSADCPGVCRSG